MSEKKIQIKEGITFHEIETDKFKTNLFALFLTVPLCRETITKNALLGTLLRRGSKHYPSQEAISKKLEEMYGTSFDCGIEKIGDNQVIKFYMETIRDEYLPQKEEIAKQAIELLLEIVFQPYCEQGSFKKEYVEGEKEKISQIIDAKIDNKASYALERCIEEMYQGKPYGLYKFGYKEDLATIDPKGLYDHYQNVIQTCKIDIFASGTAGKTIQNEIEQSEEIIQLKPRKPDIKKEEKIEPKEEKQITEEMDISQGKLVMGLQINSEMENKSYIAVLYNAILGGGANSKLFQNVREKESLAYTASSTYLKRKQTIFIRAGIEVSNYEKALHIIEKQLQDMKQGNFSEEDIQNAKNLILATVDNIEEEQDTEISYYFGQEIAGSDYTIKEYKRKIEEVTKEQIVQLAQEVMVQIIYFLKGKEE